MESGAAVLELPGCALPPFIGAAGRACSETGSTTMGSGSAPLAMIVLSPAIASYRGDVRFDGDALVLFLALTAIFAVSAFVLPFLGYVSLGLSLGAIALTLDIPLLIEARQRYTEGGGDGGPADSGDGPDPSRGGGPGPSRGGGSGVREPRRPKDRPPSAARARR